MKKKILCVKNKQSGLVFILVSMVIILLVGIIVWYNAPIKLMDLDTMRSWKSLFLMGIAEIQRILKMMNRFSILSTI